MCVCFRHSLQPWRRFSQVNENTGPAGQPAAAPQPSTLTLWTVSLNPGTHRHASSLQNPEWWSSHWWEGVDQSYQSTDVVSDLMISHDLLWCCSVFMCVWILDLLPSPTAPGAGGEFRGGLSIMQRASGTLNDSSGLMAQTETFLNRKRTMHVITVIPLHWNAVRNVLTL